MVAWKPWTVHAVHALLAVRAVLVLQQFASAPWQLWKGSQDELHLATAAQLRHSRCLEAALTLERVTAAQCLPSGVCVLLAAEVLEQLTIDSHLGMAQCYANGGANLPMENHTAVVAVPLGTRLKLPGGLG